VPLSEEDYDEFVGLFSRVLRDLRDRAEPDGGAFRQLLQDHLGADPVQLPIVSDNYSLLEQPNLQLAVESFVAKEGRSVRLLGILGGQRRFMGISLRDLIAGLHGELAEGPVEYENRPIGVDTNLQCVNLGLYLVNGAEGPAALFVHRDAERGPGNAEVIVDVAAPDAAAAGAVLAELRSGAREHNVYRGQMISLGSRASPFGPMARLGVTFHPRPTVERPDIVLPDTVLDRIERHVLGIGRSAELLLGAGRHLKRGLLLHGAPGTGKTLTVRYLANCLREATVIILSGTGLGAIEVSCAMARELAPALVVLEDVDLVAQERSLPGQHGQPLLFQLMNELEGIGEDVDVAFVLTTNRPELLEPALAARPGRVDLAVELERPDAKGRRRLIELYGQGLDLRVSDWDRLLERTDSVTPAFIKEWLRSAVLRRGDVAVELSDPDLHESLDELLDEANALTRVLLGGTAERAEAAGLPFPGASGLPASVAWLPGADSLPRQVPR
jgi:cell division protease FtsH